MINLINRQGKGNALIFIIIGILIFFVFLSSGSSVGLLFSKIFDALMKIPGILLAGIAIFFLYIWLKK